jgi:hypothetical protein
MADMSGKLQQLIFFIGLTVSVVSAQTYEDLYLLYTNHKIEQLASRLSELEKRRPSDPELVFFKAIFLENGEEAMKTYQELFNKTSGRLQNLIAEKMSAYYFAQGYYVKSDEYKKLAAANFTINTQENVLITDNTNNIQAEPEIKAAYIIQVGAFGVRQNAEELTDVLQKGKIDARLVTRLIGDKDMFCVWIYGDDDYEATKRTAEEIKQKFKLTYRILKP